MNNLIDFVSKNETLMRHKFVAITLDNNETKRFYFCLQKNVRRKDLIDFWKKKKKKKQTNILSFSSLNGIS